MAAKERHTGDTRINVEHQYVYAADYLHLSESNDHFWPAPQVEAKERHADDIRKDVELAGIEADKILADQVDLDIKIRVCGYAFFLYKCMSQCVCKPALTCRCTCCY